MDITKSQLRPKLGWQADRPQEYIGKRRGSWGGIVWSKWLSIITCSVANHVVKQIQWRIYLCPHLEVIILVESLCNMRKQQLLGVLFRIVLKGIQLKYLFDLIDTSRAEGVSSRTTYTQTKWASPPVIHWTITWHARVDHLTKSHADKYILQIQVEASMKTRYHKHIQVAVNTCFTSF